MTKEGLTLVCPIRGRLSVSGKSKDGLRPLEERYRVEALHYLVEAGYPKENFIVEPVVQRLGNAGRNSLRADFAILDSRAQSHMGPDEILQHAVVLGEVKRDHAESETATAYQVEPLLAFARSIRCVAVFWDDVDQRVFWSELDDKGTRHTKRGPIEMLPGFGQQPGMRPFSLLDLRSDPPLKQIFKRIEDLLHSESIPEARRFQIMLQVLLSKIYDETESKNQIGKSLRFQDYSALNYSDSAIQTTYGELVRDTVGYYQAHLPEELPKKALINTRMIKVVAEILAPYMITTASSSVIQGFYMYFARGMYRWDLAQYFTPPPVTNFIIDIVAPTWYESVLDPACGSADFLTSAYRRGVELGFTNYADRMHGYDASSESVQVAVLNMVLHGDGKSNIVHQDSLLRGDAEADKWDVAVCNPPFGRKIVESKASTLQLFDQGSATYNREPDGVPLELHKSAETGILFAELVVRMSKPGGRIALILPNGYLGNTSARYVELRKWLLRHTKVAALIALPRFTFKSSGADVSATVVFLEKRNEPLDEVPKSEDYNVAVHVIEQVGWNTGDKRGAPLYRQDPNNGNLILDDEQEPIVDADFDRVLSDIRGSAAAQDFPWLAASSTRNLILDGAGYSISVNDILSEEYLTLDAKRYCQKVVSVRASIKSHEHFHLGSVVEIISERTTSEGQTIRKSNADIYRYVELGGVDAGMYRYETMRGWELPDRARHFAEPGDLYIASVWGSVRKWCVVGDDAAGLVITNGMLRLRMKPDVDPGLIVDIVAGFASEAYTVQMRALARGSDGLAEIRAEELGHVVLPKIPDGPARDQIKAFVDQMLAGMTSIESAVRTFGEKGLLPTEPVTPRSSHTQLV